MSRVPRIRFKGFEEDWEQRKFSDLAETHRGLTYKPSDIRNAGTRVLRSSNITEDQFTYGDDDIFVEPDAVNIPYANQGDILITSANGSTRLVGKHTIIRDIANNSAVHGGFMLLATAENSGFVNALMSAPWYTKFISLYVAGGNGAIGNLNKSDLDEQDVFVPGDTEQKVIGRYFSQLDHLITLHQRKLKKLKNIKKSMLENLFPKNGEKTPRIRFSGFTEDWEQRKLGEVAERLTRKNEKLESILPLTISAQQGLVDQNDFFDKRIASKDVSGYYLIRKGEFAYNKSTSMDAPFGAIKRLDKYGSGVLSTLYIVFKILDDNSTNSDYIVAYYDTNLWHKAIQSIAAEGARNHGLLNIVPNDFFETLLSIPKNISEQKRIGTFVQSLDHLITLHQSKLEKLQKIKKSMLESMFV